MVKQTESDWLSTVIDECSVVSSARLNEPKSLDDFFYILTLSVNACEFIYNFGFRIEFEEFRITFRSFQKWIRLLKENIVIYQFKMRTLNELWIDTISFRILSNGFDYLFNSLMTRWKFPPNRKKRNNLSARNPTIKWQIFLQIRRRKLNKRFLTGKFG